MVIEYIRYRIADDQAAQFERAYARAAESLRASPMCLGYELSRCVEEPACWILRIVWTSVAEHMQGFRKSAQFPPFLQEIRPFVTNIEEMRHYDATELAWTRGEAAAPGE